MEQAGRDDGRHGDEARQEGQHRRCAAGRSGHAACERAGLAWWCNDQRVDLVVQRQADPVTGRADPTCFSLFISFDGFLVASVRPSLLTVDFPVMRGPSLLTVDFPVMRG